MRKIELHNIPIYLESELVFKRKWDRFFKQLEKQSIDSTMELIKSIYFPKTQYKYNQTIGYICVSMTPRDIEFEIFKDLNFKSIPYNRSKMLNVQNIFASGTHFKITNSNGLLSNEEISNEIEKFVRLIFKEFFGKRNCLDSTILDNIISFVDYRKIYISNFQ